jgi:hypothetical protein
MKTITAVFVALFLAIIAPVIAGTMTKPAYQAAEKDIATRYDTDKTACKQLAGNAKDVCMLEAKGHEKVANAELKAKDNPSIDNDYDLRMTKAKTDYAVAEKRCDDFAGNVKSVCSEKAKSAYVAAQADAKMVKKTNAARQDASAEKQDANYEVAKQRCESFAGSVKDNCLKSARARYPEH